MKPIFTSVLAKYLEEFVALKRSLGYQYDTGVRILAAIDRFALEHQMTSVQLDERFTIEFSKQRPTEGKEYCRSRVSHLAEFCDFLNENGIACHRPVIPRRVDTGFVPHIYNPDEIKNLLKTADRFRAKIDMDGSALYCVPTLLRLLYSTGIRIGEAFNLKDNDFDYSRATITITKSKNGRQRIIPISRSLVRVCENFVRKRNSVVPKRSNYFFQSTTGNRCRYDAISKWFRKILKKTGIKSRGARLNPRIHDLRHTFAVTSIAQMRAKGKDPHAALPILSIYMGHLSINATAGYLWLEQTYFSHFS